MDEGQFALLFVSIASLIIATTSWVARRKIEVWEQKDEEAFKEKHEVFYAFLTYPTFFFTKKNVLKSSLLIEATIYSILGVAMAFGFVASFLA